MAETVKAIPDTTTPLAPGAAPPPPTPTPTPPTTVAGDITKIRTAEELRKIAEQSVGADIEGQINPLKNQVGTLQNQEGRAVSGIQDMFGTILPFSAAAAGRVQGAYDTAEGQQASIMQAATKRMNDLRQSRAQEAQALAQEMGGPVAVGEFTSSMGYEPDALAALGAGQQLHTLQYGLADVGEANAFAGRVLPLVQTEETAKARAFYEDQIKELNKSITQLEGTRSSKVNAAANDLLIKEREFQIQKNQQALDKLKADHDWQATLRTLKNEETRIKMAKDQFALDRAQVTGKLGGKDTLEMRKLTLAEKQQAQAAGMSEKEYQLRKQELNDNSKLAAKKLAAGQRLTWAQYLDAAVDPQPGKTITTSHTVPVPDLAATTGKVKDAFGVDKNGNPTSDPKKIDHYEKIVKSTDTYQAAPITDPTQLVDYLVSHNVPKSVAVNMVKKRLALPSDWVYGEKTSSTGDTTRPH